MIRSTLAMIRRKKGPSIEIARNPLSSTYESRPDLYQPDPFANVGGSEDQTMLKEKGRVNLVNW